MDVKRKGFLLTLGLMLFGLFLVGCTSRPEVTPAAPPPTAEIIAGGEEDAEGTEQPPLDVASRFPLPAPEQESEKRADSSNCVDCHTSEETLKQLAKEPEEEESLSEGEG